MRERYITDLMAQLNQIRQNQLQSIVNQVTILLERYCAKEEISIPDANYVGLLKIQFPSQSQAFNTLSPVNYIYPLNSHLISLQDKILDEKSIKYCRDTKSARLIDLINASPEISAIAEEFSEKQSMLTQLRTIINDAQLSLVAYPGPPSSTVEKAKYSVEQSHIPFLTQVESMAEPIKNLATTLASKQLNYQTNLENIEKDLNYLEQLKLVLAHLQPVLNEFVSRYKNSYTAGPIYNGQVIFNPETIQSKSFPGCNKIDLHPTLMTQNDAKMALKELDNTLKKQRLLWLDQKYSIQLKEFTETFVAKQTRLKTALYPEHYQFIDFNNSCTLVQPEYLTNLAEAIQAIGEVDSQFPNKLENALGTKKYSPLNNTQLLQIPLLPSTGSIDLDNLPDNHLDTLKNLKSKSWNKKMESSIQRVMTEFSLKLSEYREHQKKEHYFQETQAKFQTLSGKFQGLLLDANAANNAQANNKELIRLFNLAAAMETPLISFLKSTTNDNMLSVSRKKYFSRLEPDFIEQFRHIKEVIRNLSQRHTQSAQDDVSAEVTERIKRFYVNFQQDYEAKNESALISRLSDNWEAGDGTTLFDLEEYFHNMFSVFDEIQLNISGIQIQALKNNHYLVSYDSLIIGRIYEDGLEHEEKSSVTEELELVSPEKTLIIRTPQGRFWYKK